MIAFSGTDSNETYPEVQQEKQKDKEESCCATDHGEMPKGDYTDNSIYQVDSDWTNQFGNDVNIGDLRGKTQVFSMIFANCTYACPILANDMRRIASELTKDQLRDIEFTLISIDPERDTPERLMQFAKDQNLNLAHFQLLTGERSDIDDLAALTGFRYKKENDGSFSHSNIITILNEEGEIVHQQVGLNQDITKTVNVIKNKNKQGV
ncbi:MAG: SCO family protein [Melioribacteraceae bacterium]|nr:SCO family protein [Melioribacteraceae bacterium]